MFDLTVDYGEDNDPLYDWRAQSTYIRRPPYWEGALAGERTMSGMRALAVLGHNNKWLFTLHVGFDCFPHARVFTLGL